MADNDGIEGWFKSLPPITRGYLVSALITTFGVTLGFFSIASLFWSAEAVWSRFEVWRIFTCFIFFGKPSFHFVFQLYLLVRYCKDYETNPFAVGSGAAVGETADVAFCLLFGGVIMLVVGYFMQMFFLGDPMVFMLLYLWSRRNEEAPVSVFGFKFKGIQLPWVFLALSVLMGNSPVNDLVGLAVGHLFFFLTYVLPQTKGTHILKTPQFLYDLFNAGATTTAYTGTGQAQQFRRPQGHQWGGGNVLGAQ